MTSKSTTPAKPGLKALAIATLHGVEEILSENERLRTANAQFKAANERLTTASEELTTANEELTTENTHLKTEKTELEATLERFLSSIDELEVADGPTDEEIEKATDEVLAVLGEAKNFGLRSDQVDGPLNKRCPEALALIDGKTLGDLIKQVFGDDQTESPDEDAFFAGRSSSVQTPRPVGSGSSQRSGVRPAGVEDDQDDPVVPVWLSPEEDSSAPVLSPRGKAVQWTVDYLAKYLKTHDSVPADRAVFRLIQDQFPKFKPNNAELRSIVAEATQALLDKDS